jgi:protein-disulfide isomerase
MEAGGAIVGSIEHLDRHYPEPMNPMRIPALLLASPALLAAACNTEKGAASANGPEVTVAAVAAPHNGDWSTIITKSPEGGFVMGNPNAKVKLVEYGSMTCPHCAEFEELGSKPLVDNYVKKGLVSWEFRNFVRDPFDMTATLIARCGGEANFFGMTRTLFHDQRNWVGKVQAADQAKLQELQSMPPARQFSTIAEVAGLKTFAAQRGVPRAKVEQCLANEADTNNLVQMNSDAVTTYNVAYTPSFMINGTLADRVATWEALEPKIKEALGS